MTVSKLRVMAVQADPPEIRPEEGTTHRVLYADPDGEGREVQIAWLTCLGEIGSTEDLSSGCEPLGFSVGTAGEGGDEYRIPAVPADALENLPEGETSMLATTVVMLCAGGSLPSSMEDPSAFDDETELCSGGEGLMAFKTFRISRLDDDKRNTNPTIATLKFNEEILPESTLGEEGEAARFDCKTTEECLDGTKIEASLTEDSFETYEEKVLGEVETMDDLPYISWFTDGGRLGKDRSRGFIDDNAFEVTWHPPITGGRFNLWAVAHDLRGGTSWKRYAIEASTFE